MTPEARLTLGRSVFALKVRRQLLFDDRIGVDAARLDRATGGRVVARGRKPQRPLAAERHDRLDRSLAERPRADDRGALLILKGAGDDLRSRSRAAVDEHDDWLGVAQIAALGVEALRLIGMTAAGRDDLAAIEEGIGHRDRLVEQAARIVAKIDNVALELRTCLLLDRGNRGL